MAEEWVFEYVLEVFETPAWNGPIVEFVDAHAHMFRDLDENLLVYTTIHKQFADLIEAQLTKRLEEVGLSVEEFVAVLEKAAVSAPSASSGSTARVVLEQLLAVEDFAVFKRMMVKRRLEVEQETLRSIVSPPRAGKAADAAPAPAGGAAGKLTLDDVSAALAAVGAGKVAVSSAGDGGTRTGGALQDADDDVARAIRESLLEAEASRRLIEYERRMLELAIAESLQISREAAAALLDSDDFWDSSDLVAGLMAGSVNAGGSTHPASTAPGSGGNSISDAEGAVAAVSTPASGAAATADATSAADERGAAPVVSTSASAEPSAGGSVAPALAHPSRPDRAPVTASVEPLLHPGAGSAVGPAAEPPAAAAHSIPASTTRFGGSALPSVAAPSSAGALHRLPSLGAASMSRVTVDSLQLSASLFGSDTAGDGETTGPASASVKVCGPSGARCSKRMPSQGRGRER
jgi:hypothetical protein